jgi:hypothetical protein
VNTTILGRAAHFNICVREMSLTTHSGLVLLQDFITRLALPSLLDRELCLKGRERGYPESEAVLALLWNLILGGDCLRDLNVLRGDAGLCEVLGVETVLAPTTAGELLRHFDLRQIHALERVVREVAQRLRPFQTSPTVTFDLDSSVYEQCSMRKEGSRKAYNGEIGYHPVLCFWAEEGELLYSRLRSGNRHPGGIARWFMARVLRLAPAGKRRFLRADSGFYSWDLIEWCEREEITYAITADLSDSLRTQIAALPESAWRRLNQDAQVAQLWYAPHTHTAHRYVVKRVRLTDKKGEAYWSYHAVITNDHRRSAKKLIQWYYQRCAMEMCQTQPIKMTWSPLRLLRLAINSLRGRFKRENEVDVNLFSGEGDFLDQALRHGLALFKRESFKIVAEQFAKGLGVVNHLAPMNGLLSSAR